MTDERELEALVALRDHQQWTIISRAMQRYIDGEISDLVALGLIGGGFNVLEEARAAALRARCAPSPTP